MRIERERERDLLDVISSDGGEVMASCHQGLHLHKVLLHPSSDLLCTAPTAATNCSKLYFSSPFAFFPICYIVSITPQNTILKEKRKIRCSRLYLSWYANSTRFYISSSLLRCQASRERERERAPVRWDKNRVFILP